MRVRCVYDVTHELCVCKAQHTLMGNMLHKVHVA